MDLSKIHKKATCCVNPSSGIVEIPQYLSTLGPSLPLVPKNEALIRYKLLQAKVQVSMAEKSAKDNLDFICQELYNTNQEIQNVKLALRELDESKMQYKGTSDYLKPKLISDVGKLKSSLRTDLSDLQHEENHLRRQLCLSRIAYRNAKLDVIMLSEDMRKYREVMLKGTPLYTELAERRKDVEKRLEREFRSKKNALSAREVTITSVANCITDHVLQKIPGAHNRNTKQFQAAHRARMSVTYHITKSFRKAREHKALALTEIRMKQNRQMENLTKLMRNIDEIRKTLSAKNQLKRMHDEEIAVEKEEVKHLLQAQGANPYLAEYLLAIEERQREVQRKMLVEEQKRLLDMQREYAKVEASKAREEIDKKKWDSFWANRRKTRIEEAKKEYHKKYFEHSDSDDEQKQISASDADEHSHEHDESEHTEELELGSQPEAKPDSATRRSASAKDKASSEGQHSTTKASKGSSKKKTSVASAQSNRTTASSKVRKHVDESDEHEATEAPKSSSLPPQSQPVATPVAREVSVRRAVHLDYKQKDSLIRTAGESTRAMILNGATHNVFNFGDVPLGGRRYILVNVANIGFDTVKLKMSVLNPYGPFTLCNALKDIPSDNYFSLKFKFEPTEEDEYHENVKIEEVETPENFFVIRLTGQGSLHRVQ